MSSSATATIAFGVNICDYEDWHFVTNEDGRLPSPWGDDDQDEIDWDDLIAEFAGWDEVDLHYAVRGSIENVAWSEQRARKAAKMAEAGNITQGCYGYEYAGQYLSVGASERSVDYGCEPFDQLVRPFAPDVEMLELFIEFLDMRGLVLKGEYRKPSWLLMATYG